MLKKNFDISQSKNFFASGAGNTKTQDITLESDNLFLTITMNPEQAKHLFSLMDCIYRVYVEENIIEAYEDIP